VLDAFVERNTRTIRGNQILIALRLLVATMALAALIVQEFVTVRHAHRISDLQPVFFLRPAGLVAIIVCALTVLYGLVVERSGKDPRWAPKLAFVQIFVDVSLISALIWHTGGADSQFVVLYLFSICAAAFVLKWNVALLAAAVSTLFFSIVGLLYSLGHMPQSYRDLVGDLAVQRFRNLSLLEVVQLMLLPVCAFFLTAILAGVLSRRIALARILHHEILEGIGEGILVLDQEQRVLYRNREFERLTGLQTASLRAKLSDCLTESIARQGWEVLHTSQQQRIETNFRRPDGSIVPFAVRLIPISESDGSSPRGLIVAVDDITAEKKMEEFLKHRQRIETMGHISATIAHEIRNPLASIRGAVQEIGRSLDIPENKKVLIDIVLSESDRLDQIITDFLRFARMRSPRLIPTDLARVMTDVKLVLAANPDARDVNITVTGQAPAAFPADAEQLRQLFLNLGMNSLQALIGRKNGALTFTMTPGRLRSSNAFTIEELGDRVDRPGVLIGLHDNGPGIPDEVSKQIFEPFFTTKPAGTGLGLAIVERIVQAHEGMVAVESTAGQGTTFRVWLPSDLAIGATVSGPRPVTVY
jgi:two-component system sensor histidine kinase PilS (NtrC family)